MQVYLNARRAVRTGDGTCLTGKDLMVIQDVLSHGTLGGLVWPNGGRWEKDVEKVYEGTRKELFDKAYTFSVALQRGHFDNVVLGLFGDHCEVTMNRYQITIDAYSHD